MLEPAYSSDKERLTLNGLSTSRRYQEATKPCKFCHAPDSDSLEHYISCPTTITFAQRHLHHYRIHYNQYIADNHCISGFLLCHMPEELIPTMSAVHDLIYNATTAINYNPTATANQHLTARLRATLRHHPQLRRMILQPLPPPLAPQ